MQISPRYSASLKRSPASVGFTLAELLVVIALIAGLTAVLLGNLQKGGSSRALSSGQAAVAGTFTVARANALSSGQPCRVLINIDPASAVRPERFLRYIVLQTQTASG